MHYVTQNLPSTSDQRFDIDYILQDKVSQSKTPGFKHWYYKNPAVQKRKVYSTCLFISLEIVHRTNDPNIEAHSSTSTTYKIVYALKSTLYTDSFYLRYQWDIQISIKRISKLWLKTSLLLFTILIYFDSYEQMAIRIISEFICFSSQS